MIYPSTTISVQIAREPSAVYAFVAALENFPKWAAITHSLDNVKGGSR